MRERMTPEEFLEAAAEGRRDFRGVTVTGPLIIKDRWFKPSLNLEGITVEGELKVSGSMGVEVSKVNVVGDVHVGSR